MKPHLQKRMVVCILIVFLVAGCAGQPAAVESGSVAQPSSTPTVPLPTQTVTPFPTPTPPLPKNCAASTEPGGGLHILFVGNSLTYFNDLPGVFAVLACAGGNNVTVDMRADPGVNLNEHLSNPATLKMLEKKWDIVVLQDRTSEIPWTPKLRETYMYKAIRGLDAIIRKNGAQTILYEVWTYLDDPNGNFTSEGPYDERMKGTDEGYQIIADEIHAQVAPVGKAWLLEDTQPEPIQLRNADGVHPAEAGTYLTACVFYATIFKKSPVGLPTVGTIDPNTAEALQKIAEQTVDVK